MSAVFPDGTSVENVQAAIQAAWLADQLWLAKQIAEEYGFYDKVCLRCASRRLAAIDPSPALRTFRGAFAYQLCVQCMATENGIAARRTRVKLPTNTNPCGEIS